MSFILGALTVGAFGIFLIAAIFVGTGGIGWLLVQLIKAFFRGRPDYTIQYGAYDVPDWVLKLKWNFDIAYELPPGEDTRPKWQRMLRTNPAKAYAYLVAKRKQDQNITRRHDFDLSLFEIIRYIYGVHNIYTERLVLSSKYYYVGDLLLYQNADGAAQMIILQALPNDYADKRRILIEIFYQQVFPQYSKLASEVIGEDVDLRMLIETVLEHKYPCKQGNKVEWVCEKYNHPFPERDPNFTITTKPVHFNRTEFGRYNWKTMPWIVILMGVFVTGLYACGLLLEHFIQQS